MSVLPQLTVEDRVKLGALATGLQEPARGDSLIRKRLFGPEGHVGSFPCAWR